MPPTSHWRLTRALRLTICFALAAAAAVIGLPAPGRSHPPEQVATVAPDVPRYTGPVVDRHAGLVRAMGQAQLAEFYEQAAAQPEPTPVPEVPAKDQPKLEPVDVPVREGSGDALAAIAAHFGDVYDRAVGVARCESTLNPNAVSRDGSNWGLFQINIVHRTRVESMGFSWSQILDADVNAAVARAIFDEQGWVPWACRPR